MDSCDSSYIQKAEKLKRWIWPIRQIFKRKKKAVFILFEWAQFLWPKTKENCYFGRFDFCLSLKKPRIKAKPSLSQDFRLLGSTLFWSFWSFATPCLGFTSAVTALTTLQCWTAMAWATLWLSYCCLELQLGASCLDFSPIFSWNSSTKRLFTWTPPFQAAESTFFWDSSSISTASWTIES